ncbi:pentapeptide repeat-containing protein, partial [Chroococcidiopsis sp.]|uniref:pentapeptide repeat-containing protein n=1 Tax=Chroococcidiopsis sp. TaxID=3088168 RepID=UPI003F376CE3
MYFLNKGFGGGDSLAVLWLQLTKKCSGCDLKYANLKSANLKGADLSKTQLDGAHLSYS